MGVKLINSSSPGQEIHRAGWVIVDSNTVIRNGYVKTENGRIIETGTWTGQTGQTVTDHGSGVLTPSFINVHTHLELSAFRGMLPFGGSFRNWVRSLLELREKTGRAEQVQGTLDGIREMIQSGTCVVGDISSTGISCDPVKNSELSGVWFSEFLGGEIPDVTPDDTNFLKMSFAGHAPHTTSPKVLSYLKAMCRVTKRPFSVHTAESDEEMEFIRTGKGQWADFLCERGISFNEWGVPSDSSVSHLDRIGILDSGTIAVHAINLNKDDLSVLKKRQVHVCLCLRSNHNLHGKLPDVMAMMECGIPLSLGTDSLASTQTLSIPDEMAYVANEFPQINPSDIFNMATQNGAEALGLQERFGSITPGKAATFVYMPVTVTNRNELFEGLIRK